MGGARPKQFMLLGGMPILARTINNFAAALPGAEIVVVLPAEHTGFWHNLSARFEVAPHTVAEGGRERFHSVKNGLAALKRDPELIAVQDGVRPLGSQELIRRTVREHKRILFSGDGYGEAWIKEAERRKLANTPGTIEALAALETPKARALFEKYKVVSPVELHARHEIQSEIFHKEINIEAETALLMVETLYIPAVTEQLTQLTSAIAQMKASGIKAGMKATTDRANRIGELLDLLPAQVEALRLAVDKESTKDILTGMNDLRKTIDTLEGLTDADLWPVPTYAELLFL